MQGLNAICVCDLCVHIGKLLELFPIHAVLAYPVSEQAIQAALQPPA